MVALKRNNMNTKLGFVKKRMIALFESNDNVLKQQIVDNYNKIRNNQCYCGHTIQCDCGDLGVYEFQHSLFTNSISEDILNKIFLNNE